MIKNALNNFINQISQLMVSKSDTDDERKRIQSMLDRIVHYASSVNWPDIVDNAKKVNSSLVAIKHEVDTIRDGVSSIMDRMKDTGEDISEVKELLKEQKQAQEKRKQAQKKQKQAQKKQRGMKFVVIVLILHVLAIDLSS